MQITIEVKNLKELKKWCQEQLSTLMDTKKKVIIDETGNIRRNKKWEQFELDQLIKWYKEGKSAKWIALQLTRNYKSVQAMVHKLRKKGINFPKRKSGRVMTIIQGE